MLADLLGLSAKTTAKASERLKLDYAYIAHRTWGWPPSMAGGSNRRD